MDCREFDRLADAFAEGTLDKERMRRMEAHISHCPSCAAVADALRQVITALDDTEEMTAPAGFADRLRARIDAETSGIIIPFPATEKTASQTDIGCDTFGLNVAAYVDGTIEDDIRSRMTGHRRYCAACDRLAHTHETVLAALDNTETVNAPAGFAARVRTAIATAPAPAAIKTVSPFRKLDYLVAACISVMVLTGLTLLGVISGREGGGLVLSLESAGHRLMATPLLFKAWIAAMIPADQWVIISRLTEPIDIPYLPVQFSLVFYLSAALTILASWMIARRYSQPTITLALHRH